LNPRTLGSWASTITITPPRTPALDPDGLECETWVRSQCLSALALNQGSLNFLTSGSLGQILCFGSEY
jgi:hypothetical protein